jgi:hypothetical protein
MAPGTGVYLGGGAGLFNGQPIDFGGMFYSMSQSVGPLSVDLAQGLSKDQSYTVSSVGGSIGVGEGVTSFHSATFTFTSPEIPEEAYVLFPALMLPAMAASLITGH